MHHTIEPAPSTNLRPSMHGTYSPDHAPCDFFVPQTQIGSFGEPVLTPSKKIRRGNCRSPRAHNKCFEDWKPRWYMFIASNGAYFEDDSINIDKDCRFHACGYFFITVV